MGDKVTMLLLLVVVAGIVGGLLYMFVLPRGNDVRKIDPSKQERKGAGSPAAKATVSKTAQLSALRERLADAEPSPTGAKKIPAKPAEIAKTPEPEKSWRPEDAGLTESNAVQDVARPTVVAPRAALSDAAPVASPAPVAPFAMPAMELPSVATPVSLAEAPVAVPALPPVSSPVLPELPPIAAAPAPAAAKVHILLVDDSKVVRVKTEKLLLNKGYAVTTAVDGIDALAKLETLKPAIIITDIEMPHLDGFGLVRNVRGNLRTAEIPVIVMTSHVNLHLDIAATEGINGFLPKPFNDQDLLDQVAFLCES